MDKIDAYGPKKHLGLLMLIGILGTSLLLFSNVSRAIVIKPIEQPWLRIKQSISHLKIDAKGRHLAFASADGLGLNVLDLSTNQVYKISQHLVGSSFFWSPDSYRLFFREIYRNAPQKVTSEIKAFDCLTKKSVSLDKIDEYSGFLTYDPSDLRMHLMHEKGILTKRLSFPDQRLGKWQLAPNLKDGKWIVTEQGVIWALYNGLEIKKMADDKSGVESFDISPDGTTIAWATKAGTIFISKNGQEPIPLPNGRDPNWHPVKPMLVYAAGRMVGRVARNYDIRIFDLNGKGHFLTATQSVSERWPNWLPDGKQIIYTKDKTTDLFKLELKQN